MVMINLLITAIMMCIRGVHNLTVTSSFRSPTIHVNYFNRSCLKHSRVSQFLRLSSSAQNEGISNVFHEVNGITCREVRIDIEKVGYCTILEATADAQNDLVNMALATEDELNENENQLHSGDPYGAVLWPAASAVANHLLSLGEDISGKKFNELTLLELGSGTGLVSIAAALGGVSKIMSTDYEQIPLQLLEFAAKNLNKVADENYNLEERIETFLFDICDESTSLPYADVVVAADIMYEPKTGIAMAHRVVEALENGSRVIVGCSPGRPGRPKFLEQLRTSIPNADFVQVDGTTCSGPRNSLICGEGSGSVSPEPKMLKVALIDLEPSSLQSAPVL